MKSRIATISALAGVLFTGVAAAAVNTQALQGAPTPDAQVTDVADANLSADQTAYANNGLVTDISAFQLVPAPVIEYQYVNVPAPAAPSTPTVKAKTKKSSKKKATSASSSNSQSDDEGDDEGEDDHEGEDD